ncbi:hypothetical protein WN55_01280 [Dufourea novaeangliae]|uniref:Uncharacterized protein n=1 Tax=Dufourea novaeangliae TaxID=178035 RepID=A0A154NWG4_DUFNO|nr:hypothetical protein WN55_01280 [Dufourea novaeangliae]
MLTDQRSGGERCFPANVFECEFGSASSTPSLTSLPDTVIDYRVHTNTEIKEETWNARPNVRLIIVT